MVKGNYCKAHFPNPKESEPTVCAVQKFIQWQVCTSASIKIHTFKIPDVDQLFAFVLFNLFIIPNNYFVPQMCQIIHIMFQ